MYRENINSGNDLEARIRAAQNKSLKKRQFNKMQRKRRKKRRLGRTFVFFIFCLTLFFISNKIKEHFFIYKITVVSDIRERANDEVLSEFLPSDTTGRPLKAIEKKTDAKILKDLLLKTPALLAKSGSLSEERLASFVEEAAATSNDEDFVLVLQAMIKSVQGENGSILSKDRYDLLKKNLSHGFYAQDSPYGQVLTSDRLADRFERMNIREGEPEKAEGVNSEKDQEENSSEKKKQIFIKSPKDRNLKDFKKANISFDKNLNMAIISNLAFEDGALSEDGDKLRNIFESASPYKHVVIDLRKSAGSSIDYWASGILPFLSPLPFGLENKIYFSDGARTYADFFSVKEKMQNFDLENSESRLAENDEVNERFKGISFIKNQTIKNSESNMVCLSNLPILLVDETTYGAAETFADYCGRNNLALVYGRKSSGSGWNLPPYLYLLPHSGLAVELQMSLASTPIESDLQIDKGVKDIKILEGDDLMQALIVELQKQ